MKKSIFYSLMSLAALLFCSTAFAQTPFNLNNWPEKADMAGASVATPKSVTLADGTTEDVVRIDSIYLCAHIDSIYPIEFGYDVSHLRLSPEYGDWSMFAATHQADDYAVTSAKNGGAGNAFKIVGTGDHRNVGAYIFRYKSEKDACKLDVGKNVLVYVFVLPRTEDVITTMVPICVGATLPTGTGDLTDPANTFPYVDLYEKAELTISAWAPATLGPISNTASAPYTTVATVTGPAKYTCGGSITYRLQVNVTQLDEVLEPEKEVICDTSSTTAAMLVNTILRKTNLTGTYNPTTVGTGWTEILPATTPKQFYKLYTFSYTSCAGAATVVDSLIFGRKLKDGTIDSLALCRTALADSENIFDLLNNYSVDNIGGFTSTSAKFEDHGTSTIFPIIVGSKGSAWDATLNNILVKNMSTGYYYFKYTKISTSSTLLDCHAGHYGFFKFKVTDAIKFPDLRAQFCDEYLDGNADFNLNTFASTPSTVKWTYLNAGSITPGTVIPGGIIDKTMFGDAVGKIGTGTHKLGYALEAADASCGGETSAIMYFKISSGSIISDKVTINYCKNTLPKAFNTNEIIGFSGISGTNNTWVLTSATASGGVDITSAISGQFQTSGSFDLETAQGLADFNLLGATNGAPTTLVFTLSNRTCGKTPSASTILTINIVDDIVKK